MPSRNHPESLVDDIELCQLPFRARLIFHLLYIVAERDYYRFPIGPSPLKPTRLRTMIMPLCPKYSDADLAIDLQRLVDARAILLRDSERGWYGVIAERLHYRREDHAPGAPRYGPRQGPPMPTENEPELKLGVMGAVPPAQMKTVRLKPPDSDSRTRTQSDSGSDDVWPNGEESKNRDLSICRKEPGHEIQVPSGLMLDTRFARTVERLKGSRLGQRLARFLGKEQTIVECQRSGAFWIQVIDERGVELEVLLEQGERIMGSELPTGKARAKFLTKRLHDRAA